MERGAPSSGAKGLPICVRTAAGVRAKAANWMRQDSERNFAVVHVSLQAADLIVPYAACINAHTSPQLSWNRRR